MTHESFAAQKEFWTPYEFVRKSKPLINTWEKARGISFFEYRAAIRNKCEKIVRGIGLPVTVGLQGVDWDSDDEILIPIDDDDILFPSVSSINERFSSKTNMVIWKRVTNYLGKDRLEKESNGILDTCNWAIRKSFLREFRLADRITILARHWIAASFLSPRLGGKPKRTDLLGRALRATKVRTEGIRLKHPSVVQISECHSVYYLHSGSISFLGHKIKDESIKDPIEYFRSLPTHPILETDHVPNRAAGF